MNVGKNKCQCISHLVRIRNAEDRTKATDENEQKKAKKGMSTNNYF